MLNILKRTASVAGKCMLVVAVVFSGVAQSKPQPASEITFVNKDMTIGGLTYRDGTEKDARESITKGRTVVAYFGAGWCVACGIFKETVLTDPSVVRALSGTDRYVVDLTNRSDPRWNWLRELGGAGIPFVAVYKNGKLSVAVSPSASELVRLVNG